VDGLGWAVTAARVGSLWPGWGRARIVRTGAAARAVGLGRPDSQRGARDQEDPDARELETALNRISALSPLPWSPTNQPDNQPDNAEPPSGVVGEGK